ncbi:MAG: formate--tetrahydrofolate ligase [Firmicutes bacterium]|jgi:formate--tetrahydrofolate ligase|nr:formate--tetrahydrofolate ligase [Bacillota bacterium]HQD39270.1 formate--tetrahydrofolate ligase [Bacillota bacterium]
MNDLEILQNRQPLPIGEIAAQLGLGEEDLEYYGKYKAKVHLDVLAKPAKGKLIYVTAINPTPAGEGKTCTAIGLTQALGKLGKKATCSLREPSLGPTFGMKGGATGGGYAQLVPMEDINLHFTGDMHAVAAAHNLLAALVDNHLFRGNKLGLDPRTITWRRVLDMNDRSLREIITGVGSMVRESGFDITAASEVMAILCRAQSLEDLKERLGKIFIGMASGGPVWAKDLGAAGSMAALLVDAIMPNLVQTLEGQPAFVHGGPFANIAHGNSSVLATKIGLRLADYVVTEGGFGADLGAEKFFDIICRDELKPQVAVVVASVRALKMHGGLEKAALGEPDLEALRRGTANLDRHLENLKKFGLPTVVAINRFPTDSEQELDWLLKHCQSRGARAAISEVVSRGGAGGVELAEEVLAACEEPNHFQPLYSLDLPIEEKLEILAREIYRAEKVEYTKAAKKQLARWKDLGGDKLPLCVAKTQYSFSDNPKLLGAPTGWTLTVREVRAAFGAGFIIPLTGEIMTMPGLPKQPAAENIDITPTGRITGLK